MLRIAVGGIHTECSTYSPVLMQPEDFRILRGPDLAAAPYFGFLPRDDVDLLPLLHARAVPGGPVAAVTYAGFKAEFLDRLRGALPLDGVYLAMHGSCAACAPPPAPASPGRRSRSCFPASAAPPRTSRPARSTPPFPPLTPAPVSGRPIS
jgi:hypothetical protein